MLCMGAEYVVVVLSLVCMCVRERGSRYCVCGCGSGHGFLLARASFVMANTFDVTRKLVCELKQVSPVPTAAWEVGSCFIH